MLKDKSIKANDLGDAKLEAHNENEALELLRQMEIETFSDLGKLINIVPDMICIAGTDGYFKYLNPEWEKVLGFSLEELKSRPLFDFIHPDDHIPTQKEIERQIKGEATLSFQNRYRCKDGSYKILEWRATPAKKNIICRGQGYYRPDKSRRAAALPRPVVKQCQGIRGCHGFKGECGVLG